MTLSLPPMKNESRNRSSRSAGKQSGASQLVHFEFIDPAARKVCVAGSFNNWKPESGRMIRAGNGKWAMDIKLKPGTYEYRLVVDGNWRPDPSADHAIMNPFGERNSLLTVSNRNNASRKIEKGWIC